VSHQLLSEEKYPGLNTNATIVFQLAPKNQLVGDDYAFTNYVDLFSWGEKKLLRSVHFFTAFFLRSKWHFVGRKCDFA